MESPTNDFDFDIAVSFAGEDRELVEDVVRDLKQSGFTVFYDEDFAYEMWGEDLVEYFSDIYERRARFAILFVSADYARKPWTNHERRSALARALEQGSTYVLPVRVDGTKLPGLRPTVGYLDADRHGASGIAAAIRAKLGDPSQDGDRKFNGKAPRTQAEVAVLLGERPPAWEYFLIAYYMVEGIDELEEKLLDHEIGFAIPSQHVTDDDVIAFARAQNDRVLVLIQSFDALLDGAPLEKAIGKPGSAGEPLRIRHFARRVVAIYEGFLDWSMRLRSTASGSPEAREVFAAGAEYASQPIASIREFVLEYRSEVDTWSSRLGRDEHIEVTFPVKLSIPAETQDRYLAALDAFRRHLRASK